MLPFVVLSVGAVAHTCIQDPQCIVCEQSFEACNPPPLFTSDEQIRMEYIGGSCSCDIDACDTVETHYTFVDPGTMTPVVVYNLKCCPSALHCPTTPPATTTHTMITTPTTPQTTIDVPSKTAPTSLQVEFADGSGSGDGSGDVKVTPVQEQDSTDTGDSNGAHAAATMVSATVLLLGATVL